MIYVIGSGPSGVSAAVALVNRGAEVSIIDVGFDLESEKAEMLRQLQTEDKDEWDPDAIAAFKENVVVHTGGVDVKYVYGSNYPYRGMDCHQPVKMEGSKMVRTLARGGLSNVWGGAILPYRDCDISDWPINVEDLAPHYRAVLAFMCHSGKKDELSELFPLYDERYEMLRLGTQAKSFLNDLEENKIALKGESFYFGSSRLAVGIGPPRGSKDCVYCGMCLYGCPNWNIYSSAFTLDLLKSDGKLSYYKGVLVDRISEKNGEIIIYGKRLDDSSKVEFRGSHVFLAAGPVSSTRILLQSMEEFERPLVIRHSDHFQIPMMRYKKTGDVRAEELNTLSQIFIELIDRSISENTIHMQVYAYNDLYLTMINRFLGPMANLLKGPVDEIIGRLLVIKGYLHSNISSHVSAHFEGGNRSRFVLEGYPRNRARMAVRKVVRKIVRNRKYFRAVPIPGMVSLGEPGIGNHSGGSFPMKKKPGEFETDELGRPYGFKNLHVVDSTIFPSIPATTISFTVMANAHRIASTF